MNTEIRTGAGMVLLTTDHPSSSYGLPVAILDNEAYGPSDVVEMADDIVGMQTTISDLVRDGDIHLPIPLPTDTQDALKGKR